MSKTDIKPAKKSRVFLGSIGTVLKNARNYQKLELSEVSLELCIQERQLKALEEEDFDSLPQYTFTRGFAINYAQFLGLDSETIAQKFDNAYPQEKKNRSFANSKPLVRSMGNINHHEKKRKSGLNPLLFIAGISVLGLALFLIRIVNEAESKQAKTNVIKHTASSIYSIEQRAGASLEEGNKNK